MDWKYWCYIKTIYWNFIEALKYQFFLKKKGLKIIFQTFTNKKQSWQIKFLSLQTLNQSISWLIC